EASQSRWANFRRARGGKALVRRRRGRGIGQERDQASRRSQGGVANIDSRAGNFRELDDVVSIQVALLERSDCRLYLGSGKNSVAIAVENDEFRSLVGPETLEIIVEQQQRRPIDPVRKGPANFVGRGGLAGDFHGLTKAFDNGC